MSGARLVVQVVERVVGHVVAVARRVAWTRVGCVVLLAWVIVNVAVGLWDRALLFALVAFVLMLSDDGVRLRRRVADLEKTVNEIIES